MVPDFYESCNEMISKWEETFKEESSCEIDVWPHLQTMISDVISPTTFGSSYIEGRKIFEPQQEQAELIITASRSITTRKKGFSDENLVTKFFKVNIHPF